MNKILIVILFSLLSISLWAQPTELKNYIKYSEMQFTWWMFDVYKVSLWAERKDFPDYTKPFALRYEYQRDVTAAQLVETTKEEWARLKLCDSKQRAEWGKLLEKIWPDISKGDSLCAWYDGTSTHFYQKNRRLGSIEAPEFSKAFFQIWLHENSQCKELRKAL